MGLEQGFAVAERPPGEGALVLEFAISGANLSLAGDALFLRAPSGRTLRYGDPARDVPPLAPLTSAAAAQVCAATHP